MSDQAEQASETSSTPAAQGPRNPYELGLGLVGGVGLLGGVVISGAGTAAYQHESEVTDYANTLAGAFPSVANQSGLAWAAFGNQLSTVGVAVLLGLAFYFMTRWNANRGR